MKNRFSLRYLLYICLLLFSESVYAQLPSACIYGDDGLVISQPDTTICRRNVIKLIGADCNNLTDPGLSFSWVNTTTGGAPYNGKELQTQNAGVWQLTVTNSNGSNSVSITVNFFPEPAGGFSINSNAAFTPKCSNADTLLNATVGANIVNYNWYRGSLVSSPIGTSSSLTLGSGVNSTATYYVTADYTVTGCQLLDNIPVPYWVAPAPDLGKDTSICQGQTVTLTPAGLTSPLTSYSYNWNSAGYGPTSSQTVATTGKYWVTVRGPSPTSCTATDSIRVTVNPAPDLNAVPATLICYGDTLLMNNTFVTGAPGPYTFEWTPATALNNSAIQSPKAYPTANTNYTVKVTVTATGCSDTETRTINVNPELFAYVSFADSTLCPGSSMQLQASSSGGFPGYNYSWSGANMTGGSTATPTVNPTSNQTYVVTVRDSRNCEKTASVNVDMLWVDLGSDDDTLAINGQTITLDAWNPSTSGFTFSWQDTAAGTTFGSGSSLGATASGKYTVFVSNGSCSVSDSKNVIFLAEIIQKVFVPNVFNPGMSESDNSNLRVYGNNVSAKNFSFRVYNQWGEIVYEANSFKEAHNSGWNGNLKNSGQALSAGVYTYTLKGEFFDGTTFEQAGTATLLK